MTAPIPEVGVKRSLAVLCCVVLAMALGACGGGDDDSSGDATASGTTAKSEAGGGDVVTIKDFAFSGASSVKAGSTVTVKNEDGTKHTFTPDTAGDFQPAALEPGTSAEIAFATAGTFAYHCEIHSSMKGSIEVTG
jgi:plastocyanin